MKYSLVYTLLVSIGFKATSGFAPIAPSTTSRSNSKIALMRMQERDLSNNEQCFDPLNLSTNKNNQHQNDVNYVSAVSSLAIILGSTEAANAAGPDWGLFEGRIGSMLHPLAMGSLLLISLSTALMGFQYRRQRTLGDEISALKKTLPSLGEASSLSAAISEAESAGDAARVSTLKAAMPIQQQIDSLVSERKELAGKNLRDSHFSSGALLAFLGTAFAIEGPLNTYARAGKLFPGPHLYAGAGLVVLWAAAAACVPAMQKGNDTARSLHIAANVTGMGLFLWQVVSGLPIMFKVIELTKFP